MVTFDKGKKKKRKKKSQKCRRLGIVGFKSPHKRISKGSLRIIGEMGENGTREGVRLQKVPGEGSKGRRTQEEDTGEKRLLENPRVTFTFQTFKQFSLRGKHDEEENKRLEKIDVQIEAMCVLKDHTLCVGSSCLLYKCRKQNHLGWYGTEGDLLLRRRHTGRHLKEKEEN
ncbi:hypothetical protein RUM43_004920 [Polyplax serrata]|uniref:Uncharacterized protein n=1 Tax=Polyplax serrata TaxID=468196 RepID=A0AAN8SEE8_POLSC